MARSYQGPRALISYPTEALQAGRRKLPRSWPRKGLVTPTATEPAIATYWRNWPAQDIYDLQGKAISSLFDRSRTLSLHLFEHVHGESPDRGQAMADLIALYRDHGLEPTAGELPDFLPLFLEFISLLPEDQARTLLAEPAENPSITGGPARRAQQRLCRGVPVALAAIANAPNVSPAQYCSGQS